MVMEIEILKERKNPLLKRKEFFFTIKHEGATPRREEARKGLIKKLRSKQNLIVIDWLKTEFGKKETVGYAKIYESEERLREIEREHIIKRNFGDKSEGG